MPEHTPFGRQTKLRMELLEAGAFDLALEPVDDRLELGFFDRQAQVPHSGATRCLPGTAHAIGVQPAFRALYHPPVRRVLPGVWPAATSLFAAAACQPEVQVQLPEVEGRGPLAILILEHGKVKPQRALAFPRDAQGSLRALGAAVAGGAEVRILALKYGLEQMQLTPGELDLVPAVYPHRRALADMAESSFRAGLDEAGRSEWERLAIPDLVASDFYVRGIDWAECAGAGGCGSADLGNHACRLDCSAPPRPDPPERPKCPEGWLDSGGGDWTCLPTAKTSSQACESGYRFYGESSCRPVPGEVCPAGPWPEGVSGGSTVFVQASAPVDGDGTSARPFRTIAQALSAMTTSGTVAVAAGTYQKTLRLDREGVSVIGACAETVVVTSSVVVRAPGIRLRSLTVSGHMAAVEVKGAGSAEIERLIIQNGGSWPALRVIRGAAAVRDTRIHRAAAHGVEVRRGATVSLDHVAISETVSSTTSFSIVCETSSISVRKVLVSSSPGRGFAPTAGCIADVHDTAFDGLTTGIEALTEVQLKLRRVRITGFVENGLAVFDGSRDHTPRAFVDAQDLAIVGTRPPPSGQTGFPPTAINIWAADIECRRCFLRDIAGQSFMVDDADQLRLFDFISHRSLPAFDGARGVSVSFNRGDAFVLERADIAGAIHHGIEVKFRAGGLLRDVHVRSPASSGVRATSGENLRIERLRVTGAVDYGIYVERNPFERASLKMEHVLVEGTSQTDENGGAGLTLVGSSDVQVSSFAMENNTRVGIWIPPPGRAIQMIHLSRGRVRGSRTGIFADVEAHVPWQILDGVQLSENGESLSK